MVVYGHLGYAGWVPPTPGCASIGVVLFFFLSGFLMGHHYSPEGLSGVADRKALRYWGSFLSKRFMRVYPPYCFAPIAGYLLLMPHMPPGFEQMTPFEDLSVVDELVKIAAFQGDLGIYWTIEVELFFYLLYPLIITLCILSRNKAGSLAFLFVALSFLNHFPDGLGGATWSVPWPVSWSGYFSIFVGGVFTAVIAQKNPTLPGSANSRHNALAAITFIALVVLVAAISRSNPTHESIWRQEWLFAALFFVLFISLIRSKGIVSSVLSSRICVSIGHASYSLYLVHIIAIYIVIKRVSASRHGVLSALAVLFVLTLAYYLLVERPFVIISKKIRVR